MKMRYLKKKSAFRRMLMTSLIGLVSVIVLVLLVQVLQKRN